MGKEEGFLEDGKWEEIAEPSVLLAAQARRMERAWHLF
jgi:hypothetical protein